MKAALDSGCVLWNGGDFYGTAEYNSLHLLKAYFEKYPEDAEKIVLSIKTGMKPDHSIDGSVEYVRQQINKANEILGDLKKVDIWEYARIPQNVSYWDVTLPELVKCVEEGLIGSVGLSEVGAETIRRAAKITKISSVELEFSLWTTSILYNDIAKACGENAIPITAYSPIGRGMLTGQIKSPDDLGPNDWRRMTPRFFPENFYLNMKLVDALVEVAKRQGCTPAQMSLAWVRQAGRKLGSKPEIIPIPGTIMATRAEENAKVVTLDELAIKEIDQILSEIEVVGRRYPEGHPLNG